ncbi:MAG TPA: toll/interleukin-1 receptor domain-containing protein [Thermoanaerobaculia bacterium]|jgi:hypothetical protein
MPDRKTDVFISYANEDARLAQLLAGVFRRSGVEAWLAESALTPGSDWQQELVKHLESANVYVLLVTPSYLQSRWGNFEMGVALARAASGDVTLLPVTFGISQKDLPWALRSVQAFSLDKNDPADVPKALETALRKSA